MISDHSEWLSRPERCREVRPPAGLGNRMVATEETVRYFLDERTCSEPVEWGGKTVWTTQIGLRSRGAGSSPAGALVFQWRDKGKGRRSAAPTYSTPGNSAGVDPHLPHLGRALK